MDDKARRGGIITRNSIEALKDRIDIEAVISPVVTLSRAGGSSLKGLCPFHNENTASFNVRVDHKRYHCFGCGESGDAFNFVQMTQGVSFAEAATILAEQFNFSLEYENNDSPNFAAATYSSRLRLLEAHKIAANYYIYQLGQPEGETARQYLIDRKFTPEHANLFGCGYAPKGWTNLYDVLNGKGFTDEELLDAGLVTKGKLGPVDRFRGRLVWPIRDTSGNVVGFGARRLYDDDDGAKYLNSPETLIYKKSKILFGLDLARKTIASQKKVIVVEGYTDVMACHAAGETSAVAACGTAFGEEHVKIIGRLLSDTSVFSGEVIYTFDGDEAGQKAAKKAMQVDHLFRTRTFVAIADDNQDPCEIRQNEGDEGVHKLFDKRIPLFEFVIKDAISSYDLSTPEGRVNAMTAAAPLVAGIKDLSLQTEYLRIVASWIGQPIEDLNRMVRRVDSQNRNNYPHNSNQNNVQHNEVPGSTENPVNNVDGNNGSSNAPVDTTGDVTRYFVSGDEPGGNIQKVLIQNVFRVPDRGYCQYLSYLKPSDFNIPAYSVIWEKYVQQNTQISVSAILDELQEHNDSLAKIFDETIMSDENVDEPSDDVLKCCVYDLLINKEENVIKNIELALGNPNLDDAKTDELMKSWDKHSRILSDLETERAQQVVPTII